MIQHEENKHPTQKVQVWLPLLLALMMVGGMVIGLNLRPQAPTTQIVIENSDGATQMGQGRVEELIRYIEAKYVDEVNSDALIEKAIQSLIGELDPHSNYLTAEQVAEVNEDLQGNFQGIGVEFMVLDDTVLVVKPIEGGPSEKVGILGGDKIIEINDTLVAGDAMEIRKVMGMLRGEQGSTVKVGVQRPGKSDLLRFNIERDKIPVHSLDIATMLDTNTGYISLNRFSATTYNEFMKGLEDLVENNQMQDLIIDLRANPGGYLQEATKILSQLFKEKKQLLVYTEGRTTQRSEYKTTGQNFFDVGNIIVLIDENSASASEILAGAIQDLDRGTVIGRRSYGKGLVQEQYALKDGSAVRLTVARYYTPSGRSIQRPYNKRNDYEDDFEARYHRGELVDAEKIQINDSLSYKTRKGRIVYGGGGITPDVFVPIDTSLFEEYYKSLQKHLPAFTYRYFGKHKTSLETDSPEQFSQKYDIDNTIVDELVHYAQQRDVIPQPTILPLIHQQLRIDIQARLAKLLFDEKTAFDIKASNDAAIQAALQTLQTPSQLVTKNKNTKVLEPQGF